MPARPRRRGAARSSRGSPLAALRLPQAKFVRPLLPGQAAMIELAAADDAAGARRWRFRVLRESDGALLAGGEIAEA